MSSVFHQSCFCSCTPSQRNGLCCNGCIWYQRLDIQFSSLLFGGFFHALWSHSMHRCPDPLVVGLWLTVSSASSMSCRSLHPLPVVVGDGTLTSSCLLCLDKPEDLFQRHVLVSVPQQVHLYLGVFQTPEVRL